MSIFHSLDITFLLNYQVYCGVRNALKFVNYEMTASQLSLSTSTGTCDRTAVAVPIRVQEQTCPCSCSCSNCCCTIVDRSTCRGRYLYHITGLVAYNRIQPLLLASDSYLYRSTDPSSSTLHLAQAQQQCGWVEYDPVTTAAAVAVYAVAVDAVGEVEAVTTAASTTAPATSTITTTNRPKLHFLWENSPRQSTKDVRDHVLCYSHLPNGTFILDSKYVLGRLMGGEGWTFGQRQYDNTNKNTNSVDNNSQQQVLLPPPPPPPPPPQQQYVCQYRPLATLPTACFRGITGYRHFLQHQYQFPHLRHTRTRTTESPDGNDDDDDDDNDEKTDSIFLDLMTHDFSTGNALRKSRGHNTSTITNTSTIIPKNQNNMWAVKDAHSNGAGGIWILGQNNASQIEQQLYPEHSYVAQQYVHPMVLFRQRKCHVRVYALFTSDERAFVHHQCFVHVANDIYTTGTSTSASCTSSSTITIPYKDSVYITNCCANSHDATKFAGEICADLRADQHRYRTPDNDQNKENDTELNDHTLILGLQPFASSIYASVERLIQVTLPFIQGGTHNHGFEYLGLDFILSYCHTDDDDEEEENETTTLNTASSTNRQSPPQPVVQPLAYLLEVNAPPSQDTATKLPHAEKVHDTVLRDLLNLWVYPHVLRNRTEQLGGWKCVYDGKLPNSFSDTNVDRNSNYKNDVHSSTSTTMTSVTSMLPSKAAILNRVRWNLYERHQQKLERQQYLEQQQLSSVNNMKHGDADTSAIRIKDTENDSFAHYARRYFPYYQHETKSSSIANCPPKVFFENAGGTQVPQQVIQSMTVSLSCRHRAVIGAASVQTAKDALSTLLGVSDSTYDIYFGSNASSLFHILANWYVQMNKIQAGDEILLQTENHVANVSPWIDVAKVIGATIRWWDSSTMNIVDVLAPNTRIVAVTHASNILGQGYDYRRLRGIVDEFTKGYGHIIVDGVTYVPHRYAAVEQHQFDWYVISCHKLFGPHLGALCGQRRHIASDVGSDELKSPMREVLRTNSNGLQLGTVNYEACEGIHGLGEYFMDLSRFQSNSDTSEHVTQRSDQLKTQQVADTYRHIEAIESRLVELLVNRLQRSTKIRIIQTMALLDEEGLENRLPIVCFLHATIPGSHIVEKCSEGGVICRNGTFLSTERFQQLHAIHEQKEGVVRLSLTHYNTSYEVQFAMTVLESIPGWM
jgi:selenocysteine lyase/cysteine desulfurase